MTEQVRLPLLCTDCRWYSRLLRVSVFQFPSPPHRCGHPAIIDVVTGATGDAEIARMGVGDCGRGGKFWEARA